MLFPLLSHSYQPPVDRVSKKAALKLVTKQILLNRPRGVIEQRLGSEAVYTLPP